MDVAAHTIGRQHTAEEHRIRKNMRLHGITKDAEYKGLGYRPRGDSKDSKATDWGNRKLFSTRTLSLYSPRFTLWCAQKWDV